MTNTLTGYPSIDKPWMKYYSEEAINTPLPDYSCYDYLWENNKDNLEDYALDYFGRKITYRKLFEMIDTVAKAFVTIGVEEKEVVPIVTISTVTSVVCFYALNRIGAVSDYLNVLSEEKDLQFFFEEVGAKVVVTLDLFGQKVANAAKRSNVKTVIHFGVNRYMPALVNVGYKIKTKGKVQQIEGFDNVLSWDEFIRLSAKTESISRFKNPNEMCLLTHTGGTTGEPKAVMLSDNALNASSLGSRHILKPKRGKVFLNIMIPFVVYGTLVCMHDPLCYGLCLALIPKFDASEWKKYFKKYKPSHIYGVPPYFSPLIGNSKLKNIKMNQLINMGAGGDGLNTALEESLNIFLHNHGCKYNFQKGYGLSEVASVCVQESQDVNRVGSVGIPLVYNNLMIWDTENKCEQGYNLVGEICIQSPSRMIGYLNNDEATKALFYIHSDGSEWLHTGDLGYIDEDGFLFLVGRMKRVILTTKNGVAYKVFPNVPERILNKHSQVTQSCVVGAKEGDDSVLRAFIVLNNSDNHMKSKIEEELRRLCERKLPSYSRPTYYEFCNNLPLTDVGKVDYRLLESFDDKKEVYDGEKNEWDKQVSKSDKERVIQLMEVYQNEWIHRDQMFWKQLFTFFYGILIMIALPYLDYVDLKLPNPFKLILYIVSITLSVLLIIVVDAYVIRIKAIQQSYKRLNDLLPERYRRVKVKDVQRKGKERDRIRIMYLVGYTMSIVLILASILSIVLQVLDGKMYK